MNDKSVLKCQPKPKFCRSKQKNEASHKNINGGWGDSASKQRPENPTQQKLTILEKNKTSKKKLLVAPALGRWRPADPWGSLD